MKINVLPIGLYGENIYVLHDHNHVLVIDPGAYAGEIKKCISPDETVDAVILTHGHEDHTGACDDFLDLYPVPVYIHPNDRQLIDPEHPTGSGYDGAVYHKTSDLKEGSMKIGTFDVTVYHTPGHTAGSTCIQYRNILFSGDTLFAGSIGRTDLFSGDEAEIMRSLKQLAQLPKDLRVLPGHGPETTIGHELKTNPFLLITRD